MIESENPQFTEHTFIINFTSKAVNLAKSGRLYLLIEKMIDYVIEECKVRNKKMLYQLTIENSQFDYPLSTGVHIGSQFDFNHMFDRIDRTAQSQKLFIYDNKQAEFVIHLFTRKL